MEQILNAYYADNAKKLHDMSDKILLKLHFPDNDRDDFYSLANEVFFSAMRHYDPSESFDGFLYSCLYKKFCSEITGRMRDKRCVKIKVKEKGEDGKLVEKVRMIPDESLDAPLGDEEDSTLGDILQNGTTVESELFDRREEGYSKKMMSYLDRLSAMQKNVLRLLTAGYLPNEIRDELQITEKQYADCNAAIHSYRNVSILF